MPTVRQQAQAGCLLVLPTLSLAFRLMSNKNARHAAQTFALRTRNHRLQTSSHDFAKRICF
eukprot:6467362-Amphidinium_carterae.3